MDNTKSCSTVSMQDLLFGIARDSIIFQVNETIKGNIINNFY